jgi:membrane protease YdiL (CAAX protease family)
VLKKLNLGTSLQVAILYIAIMGVGMYIMHSIMGATYGDVQMMYTLIWVELILSLVVIIYVKKYSSWKAIGFSKIKWKQVLWLVPFICLLIYTWFDIYKVLSSPTIDNNIIQGILIIAITTLFVGFSEEAMFRGIVLRGALTQNSLFVSMFISAITFSLLHSVNVFGGASIVTIPLQLLNTFIFGLLFAPLALKIGNLIPLIIIHWLWDFTVFVCTFLSINSSVLSLGFIVFEVIVAITLWLIMKKDKRMNYR